MTLYERRKIKNRVALAASSVAAMIGLFWLLAILGTLVVNDANQEHGMIRVAGEADYARLPIGAPRRRSPRMTSIFDDAASLYTRARPEYPPPLVDAIFEMRVLRGRTTYLSDLFPLESRQTPFLPNSRAWPLQRDRSVAGRRSDGVPARSVAPYSVERWPSG